MAGMVSYDVTSGYCIFVFTDEKPYCATFVCPVCGNIQLPLFSMSTSSDNDWPDSRLSGEEAVGSEEEAGSQQVVVAAEEVQGNMLASQ